VSEDQRWITIDGRRWRATDPSIPDNLRNELVDELMAARRAVAVAQRTAADDELRRARHRVHAAKVALGERGAPWWDEPSDADRRGRARAAIEALAGHRAPDGTICPSDAARVIGGTSWRRQMDLVRGVAADLAAEHVIEVTQRGARVAGRDWRGPVRIRACEH
jgi:hypothetical protein